MRLTSFDVETRGTDVGYGLQPARLFTVDAWVTMCAMVPAEGDHLQLVRPSADQLRRWLLDCSQKKTTIVCWNAAFDIAWLLAMGLRDEVYACNWLDGMLLWKYISNSPDWLPHAVVRYGLKQAVETFLPHFAGYDEGIDFDTDDPEEFKKLMSYNVKDALYTTMLAQHFWEQMSPEQRRCATIEARCLPMVAEANLNGICMDMNAASMLVYKLEGAANEALEELHRTDPNVTPDVLASPAKLRKLLFEDWGLTSVKETDKGAFSTDRDALSLLADVDPRAALLNSYRENKNNATKFAYGTLEALQYNGDGKARPTARVFSTYTGRMTYSSAILKGKDKRKTGVPLHQWKRDPEFRRLILAPEGQTLMEFDFSGQEFRWMAVMSNDATMLNLCAPGEDAHAFMGATIGGGDYRAFQKLLELKDPATKNLRQLGKVGNLSCLAKNSCVLTNRGYVAIQNVKRSDLLWDGVEWVSHDGVVSQGFKKVIEHDGIIATPDHKVWVKEGWVELSEAARHNWTIEPALGSNWEGPHGASVWGLDRNLRPDYNLVRIASCVVPLRLRAGEAGLYSQYGSGSHQAVCDVREHAYAPGKTLQNAGRTGKVYACVEASTFYASTLHEPKRQSVRELWGTRDRVSAWQTSTSSKVDTGEFAARNIFEFGYGSDRQQRTLRAGKPAVSYSTGEFNQPPRQREITGGPSVGRYEITVSLDHDTPHAWTRYDPRADHVKCAESRDGEAQRLAGDRDEIEVFDILNAGPRNRFTVNGRIVSNCAYRTSWATLQRVARVQFHMLLADHEARKVHASYRKAYPGAVRYWAKQIEHVTQYGYVDTIAGRRINLLKGEDWEGKWKWGIESTSINGPIQGSGADQKYLAMAVLRDYLPTVDGRFYFELHDSMMLTIPDANVSKAYVQLKHLLSNLPYKSAWGVDLPIQFPVDGKIGKSWGEMYEPEE